LTDKIAVIGAGLIGRSWAIVFARAGHEVALFDQASEAVDTALTLIDDALPGLAGNALLHGASPGDVRARIRGATDLADAVDGVVHVQENTFEREDVKRQVFGELDRLASPETVLASSSSGLRVSRYTEDLDGRARCLVAHPINPPHLVPLVEIVPAPWTDPAVVERTHALMKSAGQAPITLKKEVDGFVANRMQGALLNEAFKLVEDGVCDAADVDIAIADGIGLRWAFMGPFETIDLNAPEGLRDYCGRFAKMYYGFASEDPTPRLWSDDLIGRIEAERRESLPADKLAERSAWRDRRLADLVVSKMKAAKAIGD
jgi:3-hydroxyacyl-CoA dehydrogenase